MKPPIDWTATGYRVVTWLATAIAAGLAFFAVISALYGWPEAL